MTLSRTLPGAWSSTYTSRSPADSEVLSDGGFGRLCLGRVDGTAAKMGERDALGPHVGGHRRGGVGADPAERKARRQGEHVCREAVAALVGRLPEQVGRDMLSERLEDRHAVACAARVAAAVHADEEERSRDRFPFVQARVGERAEGAQREPSQLASVVLRAGDPHSRLGSAPLRTADEEDT